jgi:hypothetical protein
MTVTPASAQKQTSPAELRLMSALAALGIPTIGLMIALMGLYMYFLPGSNSPVSIIP